MYRKLKYHFFPLLQVNLFFPIAFSVICGFLVWWKLPI